MSVTDIDLQAAFANLNLRVFQDGAGWKIRVSDLSGRDRLFDATSPSELAAKTAAVDFALARLFGSEHGKDATAMAQGLSWSRNTNPR